MTLTPPPPSHHTIQSKLVFLNESQHGFRKKHSCESQLLLAVHDLAKGLDEKQVPVTSGVPQGTVLGPLLFLVFINDLPDNVSSNVRLFADDCLLYRRINTPEDTNILQQDLRHLEEWEAKWQMSFNPKNVKY